jgi:adenylate kinase family enzyme
LTGRVVVLGVSGAGKTTLAKRVGPPYLDMNALLDGPCESVAARIDDAIASETWAADASLQKYVGDRVLEQADLIVWLDLPLRIGLRRLWRRSRRDGESAFGLAWGAIRSHYSNRRRFPDRLARFDRVVRLRSPRAVAEWAAAVT